MKLIQVFDWLRMPSEIGEDLADFYEAMNDSYHRWYPKEDWGYPPPELKAKVNAWLKENGIEEEPDNKYFYVLIHISW